jgi:hypothetical protein
MLLVLELSLGGAHCSTVIDRILLSLHVEILQHACCLLIEDAVVSLMKSRSSDRKFYSTAPYRYRVPSTIFCQLLVMGGDALYHSVRRLVLIRVLTESIFAVFGV